VRPGDFTPVCTTELAAMANYAKEFEKRGVKLLGISCDDVQSHKEWTKDIEAYKVRLPDNLFPLDLNSWKLSS
jgi:1-Cys peroxiredoxin 6